MDILLVNDDGINSPALLPTLEILSSIGNVTAVIPTNQQSWTSKINTRNEKEVQLEEIEIEDFQCYSVDLFPADCANLGIYLHETKPDLVVSGANVGHNVGLHAFFSSGTVGAAIEGVIAGIPSIAVSCAYEPKQKITSELFRESLKIVPQLIEKFILNSEGMALLNLNLPLGINSDSIIPVSLDSFCFGSLFNIENQVVKPKTYYELNRPISDKIGKDTWARKEKKASLTAFDNQIQCINIDLVQNWLKVNGLAV